MKKTLIYCLTLLGSLAFWQCNEETFEYSKPTEDLPLKISRSELVVPITGSSDTISIQSPGHWALTVEYPETDNDKNWVSVTPDTGKPGMKTIKIVTLGSPMSEDRSATLKLSTTLGESTTMEILQTNTGFILDQELYNIESGDTVLTVKFSTSLSYDVEIADADKEWIEQITDSKAGKQELQLQISANPKKVERTATVALVEKGGGETAYFDIVQAGMPDGGALIYAKNDLVSNLSLVRNGDGKIDAWMLRPTIADEHGDSHIGETLWWYAIPPKNIDPRPEWGDEQYAFDGKDFALRFFASSGFDQLCIGCFGTQPAGSKVVLYGWDTDYKTTTASTPVFEKDFVISADTWAYFTSADEKLPAGDYLIVLKVPAEPSCGVLVTDISKIDQSAMEGYQAFSDGEPSAKIMALSYEAGTIDPERKLPLGDYGCTSMVKVSSTDGGVTWNQPHTDFWINNAMFQFEYAANAGGPLAATNAVAMGKVSDVSVMVLSNPDGTTYVATDNGGKWTVASKAIGPKGQIASIVVNDGEVYLYYIKDGKVNVAYATASGAWQNALTDGGTVFTLPEDATNASVAYNTASKKFELVVISDGKVKKFSSEDPKAEFADESVIIDQLRTGASSVSFVTDGAGQVGENVWLGYVYSGGVYVLPL